MNNFDSKDSNKISPSQQKYMAKVAEEAADSLQKMAHAFSHIASSHKKFDLNTIYPQMLSFVRKIHEVCKKEEIDPLVMLTGYIGYFDEMLKRVCASEVGKSRAEIEEMIENEVMNAQFNPPGFTRRNEPTLDGTGEKEKIH